MEPFTNIVPLAGILGFYLIALVALIGGLVLLGLRILRGGARNQQPDETAMIQELHAGLARMEERVEALETILLDREKQKERS